jgi:conjugative transposon TraN protein
MKRFSIVMITGMFCLFLSIGAKAQHHVAVIKSKRIEPYTIDIGYSKTSNLIFPYAIKSVDRGSGAVLVQKAKGVENILQVKAAVQNFEQTNLSVVTSDGQFFSFLLNYAVQPSTLNISFYKDSVTQRQDAFLTEAPVNDAALQTLAGKVQSEKTFLHQSVREQKVRLSLRSIYLADGSMWYKLQCKNKTLIDYRPGYIRFFLQDRKRAKKTAVQETELQPLYASPVQNIKGMQGNDLVFGFTAFTIPKTQELIIQMGEQNGGRSLTLRINNRTILKARVLNQ